MLALVIKKKSCTLCIFMFKNGAPMNSVCNGIVFQNEFRAQ